MNAEEQSIVQDQLKYLFVAIVFSAGAYFLFGGPLRAMLLFIAIMVCLLLNLARRWLIRGGFLFLVLVFLVAFAIIPNPENWSNGLQSIKVGFCHKP